MGGTATVSDTAGDEEEEEEEAGGAGTFCFSSKHVILCISERQDPPPLHTRTHAHMHTRTHAHTHTRTHAYMHTGGTPLHHALFETGSVCS